MDYIFDLSISPQELLKFYSGQARQVTALDRRGLQVAFPAEIMRPYVGRDGISGTFRLVASREGRLERVERLA